MAKTKLVNLLWVMPDEPFEIKKETDVCLNNTNIIDLQCPETIPAIILYPSLLTPSIVANNNGDKDDNVLKILLLTKDGPKPTFKQIENQLKICPKFDHNKKYSKHPIRLDIKNITINDSTTFSDNIISEDKKFNGIVDERIFDYYKKNDFTQLFWITIKNANEFISINIPQEGEDDSYDAATPDLIPNFIIGKRNYFYKPSGHESIKKIAAKHGIAQNKAEEILNHQYNKEIKDIGIFIPSVIGKDVKLGGEIQDKLMYESLIEMYNEKLIDTEAPKEDSKKGDSKKEGDKKGEQKDSKPYQYQGTFCFATPKDLNMERLTTENPIQSYHPVFYYEKLTYANIGHIADPHIVARQHILKQSSARVIETNDKDKDIEISPKIGSMMNLYSQNFGDLLDKLGTNDDVDIILLLGDFIDHIPDVFKKGAYSTLKNAKKFTVPEIWDIIKVGGTSSEYYHNYVSMACMFSMIVYFYSNHQKPIFAVSGNHDCYSRPIGISPRAYNPFYIPWVKERANEGICADNNLTFYEGCLMFGKSYSYIGGSGNANNWDALWNLFQANHYKWFYSTFTPFSDFAINLPRQVLLALDWGNGEDLIQLASGQPMGHLGRAKKSVSDIQLKLITDSTDNFKSDKQVILASHFTYICYNWPLPIDDTPFEVPMFSDHTQQDWGTFNENRDKVYSWLDKGQINIFFSGHTHRRGVYLSKGIEEQPFSDQDGHHKQVKKYLKTEAISYTAEKGISSNDLDSSKQALVICVDSSGPLPRSQPALFGGYGGEVPSFNTVTFDDSGKIKKLINIQTENPNAKPRFVVGLDYLDLQVEEKVLETFESNEISEKQDPENLTFNIKLINKDNFRIADNIEISDVRLFSRQKKDKSTEKYSWVKVKFNKNSIKWINQAAEDTRQIIEIWNLEGDELQTFLDDIAQKKGKDPRRNFMAIKFRPRTVCDNAYKFDDSYKNFNFDSWWTFEILLAGNTAFWSSVSKYELYRDRNFEGTAEVPKFQERTKIIYGDKYS